MAVILTKSYLSPMRGKGYIFKPKLQKKLIYRLYPWISILNIKNIYIFTSKTDESSKCSSEQILTSLMWNWHPHYKI